MKTQLLQKCIELFDKKGFAETSIQDITDSLGVTKGTFYYYFNSKQQVLMEIHEVYINDALHQQSEILANPNKSAKTMLMENIRQIVRSVRTDSLKARVYERESRNLQEDHLIEIKKKRDLFFNNFLTIIQTGMENGEFRSDLNPTMVTFGVLGMCRSIFKWYNPEGKVMEDELVHVLFEMAIGGLDKGDSNVTNQSLNAKEII
jgi:AcrR family transcriptional regulator